MGHIKVTNTTAAKKISQKKREVTIALTNKQNDIAISRVVEVIDDSQVLHEGPDQASLYVGDGFCSDPLYFETDRAPLQYRLYFLSKSYLIIQTFPPTGLRHRQNVLGAHQESYSGFERVKIRASKHVSSNCLARLQALLHILCFNLLRIKHKSGQHSLGLNENFLRKARRNPY